ncbi:MAG: hypothetical protein MUE62_12505 [Burkholderiaceae bacterium]|jgi:hypothetical protein|nr:hypothetical protein [Burkholderiaceae bacterium]
MGSSRSQRWSGPQARWSSRGAREAAALAPPLPATEPANATATTVTATRPTLLQWADKTAHDDDKALARLLAGLDDAALADLASQYAAQTSGPQAPWVGAAQVLTGVLLLVAAAAGWAYDRLDPVLVAVVLVVSALAAFGAGTAAAVDRVRRAPMLRNYRRVGLFVSVLDEFHPWLLETQMLRLHPAAEEYRRQVISQRGALRGVDATMMRAIIRAREALEGARPSAAIARELQLP